MLYYLYEYLTNLGIHIPGLGMFKFISFRAGMAVLLSLIIAVVYGKKIINYLRKKQMGELVRDLGLEGQKQKEDQQKSVAPQRLKFRYAGAEYQKSESLVVQWFGACLYVLF